MRPILQRNNIILTVIVAVGLLIRILLSLDSHLHKWDERYHALVSKNSQNNLLKPVLYKNPALPYDFKSWSSNHVWLHKQPLPIWLISTTYKLFGVSEVNTRLPSIFLSAIAIVFIYFLGKNWFGARTGLLAAFFYSINGLLIELCAGRVATDHYDTHYLVYILVSIFCSSQYLNHRRFFWVLLAGIFLGAAILTKWLPALVVLLVQFTLFNRELSNFKTVTAILVTAVTAAAISLPWQFYILKEYPSEAKWEYFHNWLHLTRALDGQTGGPLYFINQIRINYSEIIYIPLAALVLRFLKKQREQYDLALGVWIFVPILFFSLAQTKMQGYISFIAPALFILTAKFFFTLRDDVRTERTQWKKTFIYLILALILILPIRYCLERTAIGFKKCNLESYQIAYKQIQFSFPEKSIILNIAEPIDFMFYHNCSAYSIQYIDAKTREKLNADGWNVFILNESLDVTRLP